MQDVAKQVQQEKELSTKVLGVVNQLQRGIAQAVTACHKADDLADKAAKALANSETSFRNVAREFEELGVTLADFDKSSEAREAYRLIVMKAYFGEGSPVFKAYYADRDTLTESQLEKAETGRVKGNNIITQQRLQWQYNIDRDGMFTEHGAKLADWKAQNAADPDFATELDAEGNLVNPLPQWEEPSRAAATRWRNSREERQRDTAYHVKQALAALTSVSEYASDPELIPLELDESKAIQSHVAAIAVIFDRYAAKDDSK